MDVALCVDMSVAMPCTMMRGGLTRLSAKKVRGTEDAGFDDAIACAIGWESQNPAPCRRLCPSADSTIYFDVIVMCVCNRLLEALGFPPSLQVRYPAHASLIVSAN